MPTRRPPRDAIGSLFDPDALTGWADDPHVRRAHRRLDAVGGYMLDTRLTPETIHPGAFTILVDGRFELVQRVMVWGLDTSRRGPPVPGQPGVVVNGRPTATVGDYGRLTGTWAELVFDEKGRIIERVFHIPEPEPGGDRKLVERAVEALLDLLALGGAPRGSQTWFDKGDFDSTMAEIVRTLRSDPKGPKRPTQQQVLDYLAVRTERGRHDERTLRRWLDDFGYSDWQHFLSTVRKAEIMPCLCPPISPYPRDVNSHTEVKRCAFRSTWTRP